jgi:EAL domain-containing protein (putative c-di-GMP-specific phosphodiesterase class I)
MADDASALSGISEKRSPERSLLDHVGRVAHNRAGRFAVQVYLSRLKPHNRQPYHIRIASRSFDTLLHSVDAQLYVMSNGDLVLMCRNAKIEDVDAVILKIRQLFRADPLASKGRLPDGTEFTRWYDFEPDFEAFVEMVRGLELASRRARPKRGEDASAGQGTDAGFAGQALDPFNLAKVDDALQRFRIADIMREQPAIVIGTEGTEEILFMEKFVSVAELQKQAAPEYNLLSDTWMFQHLTETIDKRVLAALARQDFAGMPYDISINLNIKTVMSREFQTLDEVVAERTGRIVVELQQIDVFSDISAFYSARDWLRDRGYRVLIDGLNPMSLQYYNPGLLNADYYKVAWTNSFVDVESAQEHAETGALVDSIGAERFILGRTDSEAAVRWALTLGVRRFQGFFIDLVVKKQIEKRGGIPMASASRRR